MKHYQKGEPSGQLPGGVSVSEVDLYELSVESVDRVPLVMNYGSNFINFFYLSQYLLV